MSVTRRIQVYVGVLLALIALFVVGAIAGPRRGEVLGSVFSGLRSTEIQSVQISSGSLEITLERQGESWVIDEGTRAFPARSDRVESLLDELVSSSLVRRITGNQALWPDFELSDELGTALTIRSVSDAGTESVREVVWGATASEAGLSYVRIGEAPDVYATDGELQFYLRQPTTYWSYLRLLPEDVLASEIIAVSTLASLSLGEDEEIAVAYALERQVSAEGDLWKLRMVDGDSDGEEPSELNTDAVLRLTREIADLVGSDFTRNLQSEPAPGTGLLEIALADGREYSIQIEGSGESFVARATGPQLPGDRFGGITYELNSAKIKRLFPTLSELE